MNIKTCSRCSVLYTTEGDLCAPCVRYNNLQKGIKDPEATYVTKPRKRTRRRPKSKNIPGPRGKAR